LTVGQRLRAWATARHFAQLGVVALLLAVIRIPAEYLRLGGAVPADRMAWAAILAGGFCLLSAVLHFFGRDRTSIAATAIGIVVLIVFKVWQLPELQ
jgi:hypothetical protein